MTDKDLLTPEQAAEILGVSGKYMYLLRHRGKGPRGFIHGGKLRYRREDVERYLEWKRDSTTVGDDY